MRKTTFAISIAAICLLTNCTGNNTTQNDQDTIVNNSISKNTVNKMSEYNLEGEVVVDGDKYTYEFVFNNDTKLPIVTTAEGYKYNDNSVKLYINRGQEIVYEHTFTKESFANLIPAADYQRSVLAGFNFNYMQQDKHDRFYFIAVVGDPDETSDISYSVGIAIDKNGGVATSIVETIETEPINDNLNQDPDEFDA